MDSGENRPTSSPAGPSGVVIALMALLIVAFAFVAVRLASMESQQRATTDELKAIRQALESGRPLAQAPEAAATNIALALNDSAVKGNPDAKLTLVEFSDFECPFCGRYTRETYGQLDRDYVQTGKIRYVFRNFPIQQIHPHAMKAGIAGECARQQGKFWTMHDQLFANQQALEERDLVKAAGAAGLDLSVYERCVTGNAESKVRRDLEEGARAGVTGTPYFFLGVAQADGRLKVLREISGAQPYTVFKSALDQVLASVS
jgi:protein-disulfide isomerase